MSPQTFFQAIQSGDLAAVRKALADDPKLANARGSSARAPDESETWTALHAAVNANEIEIARTLIEAGADLEARTHRGAESRTALHDSIEFGRREITQLLLTSGAEVDICSAAILGKMPRVRELLDADPELVNDRSSNLSPLGWASFGDQATIAKELIDRGARMDDRELFCAAMCGHARVARTLIEHGCDPDERNEQGLTPLHAAAMLRFTCDAKEFVSVLIEAGADVNARSQDGRTPLGIAESSAERERLEHPQAAPEECKQYQAVAELLRAAGAKTG